jgi:hypothetical protein
VTRNADQETLAGGFGVHKPLCFWRRKTISTEVHACGTLGERDVHAIIDQDARCRSFAH